MSTVDRAEGVSICIFRIKWNLFRYYGENCKINRNNSNPQSRTSTSGHVNTGLILGTHGSTYTHHWDTFRVNNRPVMLNRFLNGLSIATDIQEGETVTVIGEETSPFSAYAMCNENTGVTYYSGGASLFLFFLIISMIFSLIFIILIITIPFGLVFLWLSWHLYKNIQKNPNF
ncbi:MAG: hypothetical protein GXY48_00485 [Methanomicrobiales archaeon]|nr:hypothetical protein [Methanomicrobiales archaeon]